jgi:hypothetical protein
MQSSLSYNCTVCSPCLISCIYVSRAFVNDYLIRECISVCMSGATTRPRQCIKERPAE